MLVKWKKTLAGSEMVVWYPLPRNSCSAPYFSAMFAPRRSEFISHVNMRFKCHHCVTAAFQLHISASELRVQFTSIVDMENHNVNQLDTDIAIWIKITRKKIIISFKTYARFSLLHGISGRNSPRELSDHERNQTRKIAYNKPLYPPLRSLARILWVVPHQSMNVERASRTLSLPGARRIKTARQPVLLHERRRIKTGNRLHLIGVGA